MDNFFTSPGLLCQLQKQPIAATRTVRLCRMGNSPLKSVKEAKKFQGGTSVVAIETSSNVSAVGRKDNKVKNSTGHLSKHTTCNMTQVLFFGSRSQLREHARFSATNHWILKGTKTMSQTRMLRNIPVSYEACNVGLHPDCFKEYHFRSI